MVKSATFIFFAILISLMIIFLNSCTKKAIESDIVVAQSPAQRKMLPNNDKYLTNENKERIAQMKIEEQRKKEREESQAKIAAEKKMIAEDIYFEYDSASLSESARKILKQKASYLDHNKNVNVIIEGHCDERGTIEYNIALGERRAQAAKSYLVDLGVSAARLKTISYGEEKPVVWGSSETIWKQNRRCHFVKDQRAN